ncbi:MAG: MaoC/PaaZ C-terminal domain-containing protein [Nocardioides sp.]|uniref:MaoC/PaaZ C-terminal domain-containing protein n=1 Tax=Nocardioides sp. TaxID=35761 RepID=UPI003F0CEE5C
MSTTALTVGSVLPEWSIDVTTRLVVTTALATRDFQNVHHDRDAATGAGSKDIFMNILTSQGMVQRYVNEQLGDVFLTSMSVRLGAPAYPGDTMVFSGEVLGEADGVYEVKVVGTVSLGAHVTATVKVKP